MQVKCLAQMEPCICSMLLFCSVFINMLQYICSGNGGQKHDDNDWCHDDWYNSYGWEEVYSPCLYDCIEWHNRWDGRKYVQWIY